MQIATQASIDLTGIKKLRSGKVREVFDLGDTLLFVVTDRLSAFDVILSDPIPHKGAVLNQLSAFWFKRFGNSDSRREQGIDNHFVTANFDEFPENLQPFRDQLAGRSMIVRKTRPLPVECVVRGYLAGSGWKEYQESQSVCGINLPARSHACDQGRGRSRRKHRHETLRADSRPKNGRASEEAQSRDLLARAGSRGAARDHRGRYEIRIRTDRSAARRIRRGGQLLAVD